MQGDGQNRPRPQKLSDGPCVAAAVRVWARACVCAHEWVRVLVRARASACACACVLVRARLCVRVVSDVCAGDDDDDDVVVVGGTSANADSETDA